jgi:hypothetical protein
MAAVAGDDRPDQRKAQTGTWHSLCGGAPHQLIPYDRGLFGGHPGAGIGDFDEDAAVFL